MKKLLILILICAAFAFAAEKKFTLTEGQAVILFNALETSKKALPTSEAVSAREASAAFQAIDSIQKVLIQQANDSTKKK